MTKLPVISPCITGNPPKISKWRLMDISEAYHPAWREDLPFLVIVGKRGKMEERNSHSCPPGVLLAPYYLGKVRHSLGNGAMERTIGIEPT